MSFRELRSELTRRPRRPHLPAARKHPQPLAPPLRSASPGSLASLPAARKIPGEPVVGLGFRFASGSRRAASHAAVPYHQAQLEG